VSGADVWRDADGLIKAVISDDIRAWWWWVCCGCWVNAGHIVDRCTREGCTQRPDSGVIQERNSHQQQPAQVEVFYIITAYNVKTVTRNICTITIDIRTYRRVNTKYVSNTAQTVWAVFVTESLARLDDFLPNTTEKVRVIENTCIKYYYPIRCFD